MEASPCNLNTMIAFRPSLSVRAVPAVMYIFYPPKHGFKSAKLFCRSFLKPITSAPTQETCDLTSLFDLEGRIYVKTKLEKKPEASPVSQSLMGWLLGTIWRLVFCFVSVISPTSQCEMRLACEQALSKSTENKQEVSSINVNKNIAILLQM